MHKLMFMALFLFSMPCLAQNEVLDVSVEYRHSSEELVFSMLNRSDKKVFVVTNKFNGSFFTLSYENVDGEELHPGFFRYVQDGKELRNLIPILSHEKIFVTYKLAKLVTTKVSLIKKIRVENFITYMVEREDEDADIRTLHIEKEFKLR